jgi:serine/threonine protein kinase/Flp pilus assembly protein TadD/thiol-disulfide isomerase/thioredoxin
MNAEEIFHQALTRPPVERSAFLAEACSGDEALQRRVQVLLHAHDNPGSFLAEKRPLPDLTVDDPISERPGAVIGPYKLMEQIGEGGMGLVFVAEQQQPIRRKVALKVIKPGMDTRQVVARFEAERQALALMDHPNIAKVLDGGTTDSRRPYFVMELVKGVPITEHCDQSRVSIRERLELFVSVCQAVQHAHQKGIIHRDIKPSNVLITLHDGSAVVKVIDFGVAKAIGQQLTDKTIYTHFSQMVGTPLYMSPEQAWQSGMDVDTRTDIYGLGVLLYELLTGTTPFEKERLREVGYDEMRRIIREEEPPKPSTRISTLGQAATTVSTQRQSEPRRLSRLIRGELDWIVMKALEKDRNRRYETANGLAGDIERYLRNEPVLACPPSAGYRFRKFARRNKSRLAVAALALFFLASLCGVAGWAALQHVAHRAALETDIGRDLDAARDFCRKGRLREASAVLDHAQDLAARGGADEDLGGRVAQVRKDVAMASRLEAIRLERSAVKNKTFDWGEPALRYAEAFRDYGLDLDQLEPDKAAARIEVSAIREQLVTALDDWLAAPFGRNQERLLAVLTRADADPWRQKLRVMFVDGNLKVLRELAREANAATQPPADAHLLGLALKVLGDIELAVEFLRLVQQEYPSDFWINEILGISLIEFTPPRAAEAVRYLQAAVALRPDSPGGLLNLGLALRNAGDLPGAIAVNQRAIALKPDYAEAHYNLGLALNAKGDLPGVIAAFRKVITLKPDAYAEAHYYLGNALNDTGDLPGALAAYRKAITLKPDYAEAYNNLGIALHGKGDMPGALAAYQKAIALKPDCVEAYTNLGKTLSEQGDLPGARAAYQKAIALKPDLALSHWTLGKTLRAQGDLLGALAAYHEAIALKPDYAEAHDSLGIALLAKGDVPGALAEHRMAIALKPDCVEAYNNLGNALKAKGDLPGAIAEYQKAIALKPDFALAYCSLGFVLQQQGDFAKALEEFRRGHELGSKSPGWRRPSDQWLRQCQRLLELDRRLPDFLAGKATPANAAERIDLAELCALKQRNRTALRFYGEAFAAQPTLLALHQYNAACAAALAGCGRGKDAVKLDEKERAHLRRQALDWLCAHLETQVRLLDKEPARAAANVAKDLEHCLADSDFVGVREPEQLAKLPPEEQDEWGCLWDEVAEQAARARDAVQRNPPPAPAIRIGQQMDLAGPTVAGGKFDLKQLRGKVVLIDFWASWCGPCVAEMPNVKRVYDRYHKDGFEVVGVSLDHTKEALDKFIKANKVPWPQLFFEDKETQGWNNPLVRKHGVRAIPFTILVDEKGNVDRLGLWGEALEKAVAHLLGKGPAALPDPLVLAHARFSIRLGHWDEAAAEYAQADLLSRPLNEDTFAYACLFLIRGDSEGYNRFCQGMIQRAAKTEDAYEVYVLARSCAMARESPVDPTRAVRWAKQAVSSDSLAWYIHVLGLAQYRAGQFDQALQSFEESKVKRWNYSGLNWFGLALVHHRLGHPDEARRCLDEGIQWLEREGPPSAERPTKLQAQDWIEAQLLRREAEEMLKTTRSP